MEYYSAMRKEGTLPVVTKWMDVEHILLSEINQTEEDKSCVIHPYMESKKLKPAKKKKKMQIGKWCLPGDGEERGIRLMVFNKHINL